ncbi:MAG: nitrile hydratase subunit alpha [Alphaproteobacteria bacterium TMED89]|nr:nitrile hydratase subunit alpha [Rhodospirillaceae bacterium]RPH15146.1 MAG: nitrile hydratase subunit alpha [Alphaproteobacteria bacterium TMED89]
MTQDHHAHHHDHSHDPIEAPDTSNSDTALLADALRLVLIEKGGFSAQDVQDQLTLMEGRSDRNGAAMIARAWVDADYKAALLANGKEAAKTLGHDTKGTPLVVLENTEDVHNVVVCTLCSCYPVTLLGPSPEWYKSKAYRGRVVRDPRSVLREFGTDIGNGREVRVHDSTADMRYMILPKRPPETDHLSEAELAALVTRNGLIGVTEL